MRTGKSTNTDQTLSARKIKKRRNCTKSEFQWHHQEVSTRMPLVIRKLLLVQIMIKGKETTRRMSVQRAIQSNQQTQMTQLLKTVNSSFRKSSKKTRTTSQRSRRKVRSVKSMNMLNSLFTQITNSVARFLKKEFQQSNSISQTRSKRMSQ